MQNCWGFWIPRSYSSLARQELVMPGERGLTFNFYDGVDLRAAGEGDMASPQASILAHSTLAAVAAQILSNILAELEEQIDTK